MKQPILGAYAVPAVWRSLPAPGPRGPVEALSRRVGYCYSRNITPPFEKSLPSDFAASLGRRRGFRTRLRRFPSA